MSFSPSLQAMIDRYINGEDDVDETTAVPKNIHSGKRKAAGNNNDATVGSSNSLFLAEDGDEDVGDDAYSAADTAASYPIFIPSKGRYDPTRPGTCALLARARVPFTVVVEPQEAKYYTDFLARLEGYDPMQHAVAVLPASNQGVSYVRNHIAKHLAPATGWFWQLDDDIRGFSQSLGNKKNTLITVRTFFKAFAERMKRYPNASLFSAEYEMFAFQYGPNDVAINSYNNIAKLFRREHMPTVVMDAEAKAQAAAFLASANASSPSSSTTTNAAVNKGKGKVDVSSGEPSVLLPVGLSEGDVYRFKVREDYDIVLRMIANGRTVVRFKDLSFRVPSMSECSGGMTDYYQDERLKDIRAQNRLFVTAWPAVSREVLKGAGKDVRFDIRVNWAALNPNNKKDPAALLNERPAKDKDGNVSDIESLLLSDEDIAVASKLKQKTAGEGGGVVAAEDKKKSSWAARRGQKNGGERGTSSKKRRGGGGGRSSRAGKKRRRRGSSDDDSDDESSVFGSDSDGDDDDVLNSDDDEDYDEDDTSASSDSSDDDDGLLFEDEFDEEDEEAYFELMENFYNPRKARAKERAAQRAALAEAAAAAVKAAKKSRRGGKKGGDADDDDDDDDDDDNANAEGESDDDVVEVPKPPRVRKPKVKAPPKPPEERHPAGWAGYAMVMWRDVEPEAAEDCGLTHINPSLRPSDASLLTVGSTVAFVPVFYDVTPSVMVGTIISVYDSTDGGGSGGGSERTVQIAPGRKYRGVPLQTVAMDRLYHADGIDPFECAKRLDAILNPPQEAVVHVTRSNVKELLTKASVSE